MGSAASVTATSTDAPGDVPLYAPALAAQLSFDRQELDDADAALWKSDKFSDSEKPAFSGMVGYLAKTTLGSTEYTMPVRHIPAAAGGPPTIPRLWVPLCFRMAAICFSNVQRAWHRNSCGVVLTWIRG